jgi:hypothetical protein
MCVICFVKALVQVFKIYLTANYTYNFRSWPVDFRWDDVRTTTSAGGSGHRALTCAAAAAGVWLLREAVLGVDASGRPRGARSQAQCFLQQIRELPSQLASYALAH